ncbi:MAG: hypothetical protein R6W97_07455 [Thiobacillus sp.]
MKKIPKQEYTDEFKALAVKRVKDGLTVGIWLLVGRLLSIKQGRTRISFDVAKTN